MERHERIPLEEVGAFVQRWLAQGAKVVVVTRNADGVTCNVSLQRD
ncbi:MAG: hypothetical protein NDI75_01905 [Candidatus Didemnitutus sp.]|nr:hypothetical protein [Candidatus Didemnitutus sp.]